MFAIANSILHSLRSFNIYTICCTTLITPTLLRGDISFPVHLDQPTQVKVVLEVTGNLHPEQKNEQKTLPVKSVANLVYDEQIDQEGNCLRYYRLAETKIEVAKRIFSHTLRKSRRDVQYSQPSQQGNLISLGGPLTRNELELLMVPGNSGVVNGLLPSAAVEGESWSHPSDVLARLMNFDVITAEDVTSKVDKVDGNIVRCSISGTAVGSVDGAVTDVKINGKYNYDQVLKRIHWFVLNIKENRTVGPITPEFSVTARIRMSIDRLQDDSKLLGASISKDEQERNLLLEYAPSDASFSFLHDRRWHILSELPGRASLRMVDGGETIAQCNLREILRNSKTQLTLEHFKSEIKSKFKANSPQIVESTESKSAGLRILRVQVLGTVAESPVQWIHFYVESEAGKGLSYVFTMSTAKAEAFAATDLEITNSLKLLSPAKIRQARSQEPRPK